MDPWGSLVSQLSLMGKSQLLRPRIRKPKQTAEAGPWPDRWPHACAPMPTCCLNCHDCSAEAVKSLAAFTNTEGDALQGDGRLLSPWPLTDQEGQEGTSQLTVQSSLAQSTSLLISWAAGYHTLIWAGKYPTGFPMLLPSPHLVRFAAFPPERLTS